MSKQLQDKVAIVTGASNGIGRAIAETFAAEGAKTILVARRAALLDEVAAGIKSRGGQALPAPADVTKEDAVAALFAMVQKTFGRLDVLVNNAGIATHKATEEITLEYWREALDINITAPFLCSREAIRVMKAQVPAGGRIINMGSISSKTPRPDSLPLHDDQIRVAGHDASADDGRTQAQHRRLDHPSGRNAVVVHDAHRPQQSGRGLNARGLRHERRRSGEGRSPHGLAAAGSEFVRSDDFAEPPALVHRPRLAACAIHRMCQLAPCLAAPAASARPNQAA